MKWSNAAHAKELDAMSEPEEGREPCPECDGKGWVDDIGPNGEDNGTMTCDKCDGECFID
jgi:DnaJ-class molecular chaperone